MQENRCKESPSMDLWLKEAKQHETECTKKRVNAKRVSLTFDNMEDEHFFNISVSADTYQKEEDLYKIQTFDSEVDNDYLIYGICEEDLSEIIKLLDYGIDNFYKEFKNDRNIIIQAHPFRNGMELANPKSIDGIEVFNLHPGHNSRIAFAAQYASAHDFIITCGSDFHHYGHEGISAILTKEPIKDSYHLAQILKSRDYIIDISGYKVIPKID